MLNRTKCTHEPSIIPSSTCHCDGFDRGLEYFVCDTIVDPVCIFHKSLGAVRVPPQRLVNVYLMVGDYNNICLLCILDQTATIFLWKKANAQWWYYEMKCTYCYGSFEFVATDALNCMVQTYRHRFIVHHEQWDGVARSHLLEMNDMSSLNACSNKGETLNTIQLH